VALLIAFPAAARPLVVILADPKGTVATDVLTPYAILAESGTVDVRVVSPTAAPVRLTPGRAWLAPQMTLAQLEQLRPNGPDVVIVPAVEDEQDAARSAWLREMERKGVRILSICNGAKILASSGLLDGREATIHWYSQGKVSRRYPQVEWRRNARWVTDGRITTTAGMSAAEPATLQLISELSGRSAMAKTAARLRMPPPDQRHNGQDYRLTPGRMLTVTGNVLAFWRREDVALPLSDGFDEHAFGTALDAWSRTSRSTAWAAGPKGGVRSRHGLVVYNSRQLPDRFDRSFALPAGEPMVATFERLQRVYGRPTARFVAVQFEHPWGLS
jgi:putative intracellular protease/amidase